MSNARRLRQLLNSPDLEFLLEAHNGLSARIVEEAGFKGIWASGLTLAAQFGVRDNNEASWTQVVDMLEFMADATNLPILLDGDTGYGNFNNMRRLVRKLEQRRVAGVCIEDKLFPKNNSFLAEGRQALAEVDEFCGKIKAGKDSQLDQDFCIVARVEALIAGWGLSEALRRGEAYHAAGADAILIHSKQTQADEVVAFSRVWAGRCPLIVVPTRYYTTPVEVFEAAGINLVIWANQVLRASITAMQGVAAELARTRSLLEVEARIAPLREVFRLQRAEELVSAEERYSPPGERPTRAVILAATRGEGLGTLTGARPKVMVGVAGKPLLLHMTDELRRQGIRDLTVVAGYRPDSIDIPDIERVINPDYHSSGELSSLAVAERALDGEDTLIVYGDLLFRSYILSDLMERTDPAVVVVDSAKGVKSGGQDYARCSAADDRSVFQQSVDLIELVQNLEGPPTAGRWIGMARFQGEGVGWLQQALGQLRESPNFSELNLPELLNHLVATGRTIKVQYIHGHWVDINTLEDLERAGNFATGPS